MRRVKGCRDQGRRKTTVMDMGSWRRSRDAQKPRAQKCAPILGGRGGSVKMLLDFQQAGGISKLLWLWAVCLLHIKKNHV